MLRELGEEELDAALEQRSVINKAENITSPIMLIHGSDDENVSVDQAIDFAEKLAELDKKHELVIVEGEKHAVPKIILEEHVKGFLLNQD